MNRLASPMMKERALRPAWVIATWFGCGWVPIAPGTMGSLGAIPLYLLVARSPWSGRAGVVVAAFVITAIGVWASSVVARDLGTHDPQIVVVDEVAGMLVTMIPIPCAPQVSWWAVGVGFLVFRLLDSVKPWPVRRFEDLPGGWGIVMDDVAAGVLGACMMTGLAHVGVLP